MSASSPSLPGGTWPLGDLTGTRFGYGAMQLAGPGVMGPPADRDGALAVLREAVNLGITHIDPSRSLGSLALGDTTDAESAVALLGETFHRLPEAEIAPALAEALEQRIANLRPQPWSAAGLMQLGSAAATHGLPAALESLIGGRGQACTLFNQLVRAFAGLA
jgi:hypothetical protein